MIKRVIIFSTVILSLFACKENHKSDNAVARVNNSYLYEEEIFKNIPNNLNREDSLLYKSNYINAWAIEHLLIDKAKVNIRDTNDEIKRLVANYEKELLIDKYKQAIVRQELDTVISQEDIDEHYNKNKSIYKLKENLVQLKYIYYSKDIKDEKELIRLFRSNRKEDFDDLLNKELEFNSHSFNDSIWISLKVVLKKLPILNTVKKIKKNEFIKKEDSLGVYLVAVNDVLQRNQIAPKSYVEPTIRHMILHKRKLELIKKIEQSLINDAINKKQFEQY